VARYGTGEVLGVSPNVQVTIVARRRWPWGATGGLCAPDGDLWLLEYSLMNAVRVRHIRPDGTSTT